MSRRFRPVKGLLDLVMTSPAIVAALHVPAAVAVAVGAGDAPAGFTVSGEVLAR